MPPISRDPSMGIAIHLISGESTQTASGGDPNIQLFDAELDRGAMPYYVQTPQYDALTYPQSYEQIQAAVAAQSAGLSPGGWGAGSIQAVDLNAASSHQPYEPAASYGSQSEKGYPAPRAVDK